MIGVGIAITNTATTISNCTISNNHSTGVQSTGGGIGGNVPQGDVTIVNTTVSGNSSDYGGGVGIRYGSSGAVHTTIINSTISGNAAMTYGGGYYFFSGSPVLGSTLIALNSAPSGPDIYTDAFLGINPTVNSAGYNLVATAVGYAWINGAGDQLGIANPGLQLDANNQPLLKDNGGPTQTIALMSGSPAIDRGFADASLTTDQRGSGFARKIGAAADVGAFEMQPLPVVTIPGPPVNPTATTNPSPKFYFTVDNPTATTFCSVAGDPAVQCTSPFTSKSLVDGSYTFSVYAKDAAGNNGPTATFAFAVDHLAPVISIPVPPNLTTFATHTPSFTFADVSAPGTGVTFQCRVDSGANVPCVSPFTVPTSLPDGLHTFAVTGTDAAGNVGQASLTFTVNTAPALVSIQVTPVNPSIPAGRTQQFTATGTFSDGTLRDLTATATWSSSSTSVARITNGGIQSGLATGVAAGTTTIAARSGSVSGSTTLTVTPALPSFTISVSPSTVKQGGVVTVTVNYSNPTSTAQTLTLKFSLTTPSSKTLMLTVPLTLKAAKSGSASFPLPIVKSTPVGVYSLTLDAFLGATQVSTSSVQLTVTK